MFGIGVNELLIFLAIILLLFGGKQLPGLMRSLGTSVTEFKKGMREPVDEDPAQQKEKLN